MSKVSKSRFLMFLILSIFRKKDNKKKAILIVEEIKLKR